MAKFVLGLFIGIAINSFAFVEHSDGGMTLNRQEVDDVRRDFHQLIYNYETAVQRIVELTAEIETLKNGKCI